MNYAPVLNKTDLNIDEKVSTNFIRNSLSNKIKNTNPDIHSLIPDDNGTFLDYLNLQGLANEPDVVILSSSNHYYYDFDELKAVRALINQKELNLIKKLNDFLYTVYNLLSPKTNFIGCFTDCKTQKGISLTSRIYDKFINFLDGRFYINIDREDIEKQLESVGFRVIDMTEIDGLTYFLTQS